MASTDKFLKYFNELSAVVNDSLALQFVNRDQQLYEAMRYSLTAGGKRLRAVLALAVSDLLDVKRERVAPYALALEFLHCASLIHDDLPALDNDDMRRGKPSCHRAFSEATALLAGDALVVEAFLLLADSDEIDSETRCRLVSLLAQTYTTLCEGQVMDVIARVKVANQDDVKQRSAELSERHFKKTAALIAASAAGPAFYLPELKYQQYFEKLANYGKKLGLLFQITDDILDVTAESEVLGKVTKSDSRTQTPTYVQLFGVEGAKKLAYETHREAQSTLATLDVDVTFLRDLCEYVLHRGK